MLEDISRRIISGGTSFITLFLLLLLLENLFGDGSFNKLFQISNGTDAIKIHKLSLKQLLVNQLPVEVLIIEVPMGVKRVDRDNEHQ